MDEDPQMPRRLGQASCRGHEPAQRPERGGDLPLPACRYESGGHDYGADGTFTTGGYYENAVYSGAAMPDPSSTDADSHSDFWALGTGSLFPVLSSPDLVHWTAQGTTMTTRPS